MKILIDARIIKISKSGVVSYIKNLLNEYARSLVDSLEILVLQPDEKDIIRHPDIQIIKTDIIGDSQDELREIGIIINNINPDIYHATWFIPPQGLTCKVVFTIYDNLFAMHFMEPSKQPVQPRDNRLRVAVERTDLFIAISNRTRIDFMTTYGIDKNRIRTIYLGGMGDTDPEKIDTSYITAEYRELAKIPYVISSGGYAYYKNQKRLVEAMAVYAERYKSPLFCLVSSGQRIIPDDFKEHMDKFSTGKRYQRIGYIAKRDYLYLLKNAQVLVIPSMYEGFGIPLLEAAKMKVPIACSDIEVFHEVMGNNALFFNPTDTEEIAEKINILLTNSNLRINLIEKAYTWQQRFSWKKTARETQTAYYDVLKMPQHEFKADFSISVL